ncbi:hypothetical protein GT348_04615 [Aristophania vespae]|uniref:Uncharacterized protein n=1 Tax=Aristophania vespae TaxID=2697033 RepID=A0A6P1NGI6_9PROT|nr:hypothetical protein [Aristophania vespae]QHI95640.1 hypothetical protein GT348_04615 [Aristophania vespae]
MVVRTLLSSVSHLGHYCRQNGTNGKRKRISLVLAASTTVALSGCSFFSPNEGLALLQEKV